jgi:UDP-glucose 4-epimerase
MRTLVTGGAGFIGSHIVDLLLGEGHEVAVVDNLSTGTLHNLNPGASLYRLNISDPMLRDVVATVRPEVVFHEAAQMSVKVSTDDPIHDAHVNVIGLLNVLESCVAGGVRKVVFASSGATYGNPRYLPLDEAHPQRPESPYGITKMVAEHYLGYYSLAHGLAYTALRYGNVYGPRQDSFGEAGVVAIFARQLLQGQVPVIHWDGEQTRDYVYVGDVARANELAMTRGDCGCYCVGTGIGTSVNEIFRLVSACVGLTVLPGRAPRRAGDLRHACLDPSRARSELGFEASVPLEEGLRLTVEHFRHEFGPRAAGLAPAGLSQLQSTA